MEDSNSPSDISSDEGVPPAKKNKIPKPKYEQHFRKSWLLKEEFKNWLTTTTNGQAFCKYCNKSMKIRKSVIEKHCYSKAHQKNAAPFCGTGSKQKQLDHNYFSTGGDREVEARLALYIAVHCSILSVEHLTDICVHSFGSNIKLKRTKCSGIIVNAWAPHFKQSLILDIGDSYYSLIIDESTDISVHKMLGIVIRYFSKNAQKIVTTFLALVQLESGDAVGITNALDDTVRNVFKLDPKKCVGLGTDNASVMTGVNNGVKANLETLWNQKLILVRCICHSLVLAVSSACEELPRNLEFLVRETYNWFSHSTLRRQKYKQLYEQIYCEELLKITAVCNTRWLSIYEAIVRITSQWEVLKMHFNEARSSEKCYSAEMLYEMYKDEANLCYLLYMKKILGDVNSINKAYQSNNNPFKLVDDLVRVTKTLAADILNPTARVDIFGTTDLRSYLDPNPYFGFSCEAKLKNLNDEVVRTIKTCCVNFVLKLLDEIRCRLPDNYKNLQLMNELTIDKVLRQLKPSITSLITIEEFNIKPHNVDKLETQWKNIAFVKWDEEIINANDSMLFWAHVCKYRDAAGVNPFQELAEFVLKVLSLPLSNAEVERVFSVMNLVKSKTRNRMKLPLLESILKIRFSLKRVDECCSNYKVPKSVSAIVGASETYKLPEESHTGDIGAKSSQDTEITETVFYENDFLF